jgi:hypothetical protein
MFAMSTAPVAGLGGVSGLATRGSGVGRRGVASSSKALGAMGGEGLGQRALLSGKAGVSASAVRSPGQKQKRGALVVRAVTGPRETRLGSILTTLPQRVDLYFKVRKGRKLLWKAILAFTAGLGHWVGNGLALFTTLFAVQSTN